MDVPTVVTHYYLPNRGPFQNLSELDSERLDAVLHGLVEMRRDGLHHRRFGAKYMAWRRLTEERLRTLFIARGGAPERSSPHYFVLGESRWFEGLATGMLSVALPLEALPTENACFTLVDSFTAMGFGPQFGFPGTPAPHLGEVYRLEELPAVLEQHGAPLDARPDNYYAGYEREAMHQFVEVQLWSDAPVARLRPDE